MDIDDAWNIIERVLYDRLPRVAQTLRGPVTGDAVERLEREIGHPLPADFVRSLERHDGQSNPTRLLDLFDHHTLLSADAMVEMSKIRVSALGDDRANFIDWITPDKVRPVVNCRGWLQFTDSEGDGYAMDLEPLPAGEVGQIFYLPMDDPEAPIEFASFGAWLSSYAEKLDAGAFRIDDKTGLWLNL
ncbi:SMI1/KNR4 family protein [Gulosibacter molinativorax]|uniref:Knr4/Smi1-like domain-containing protein n=1 Tax=Gulosibacter molinativorax TaxID=256821 RepID=A0ABT7C960_9MICO|nr:SMI1/KNR4 family protein [Gulosibacter molinativorax]MDJ1371687.1 hypothetical protein [Gulosibacter molinativorax]QUY63109.1 Hypotetical protein [Gulosibacter molinativorax]